MITSNAKQDVKMRSIGPSMVFTTREQAETSRIYATWRCWASQLGIKTEIQQRVYYNLPDDQVLDSMDSEPTMSRIFYDLYAALPDDADLPDCHAMECASQSLLGLSPEQAVAKALAETEAMRTTRADKRAAKQSRAEQLLADVRGIITREGRVM
ncbi:MAG: hypothetical protein AAF539_15720, partial [Planctomycetota bacterium]